MASHIARRRPVASSAGSPMPANPTMPHMSASSQSSTRRRSARLGRVAAQYVGSRPEDSKEEIEQRKAAVSSEETSNKVADNRALDPQDLYRAVVRLEERVPTSHMNQHRPHQTQPEQQPGKAHLGGEVDIGVMR